MPKQSTLVVTESIDELSSLLRKQSNPKNILRIQSLIHIKEGRFAKRSELASHLGYGVRSMEIWLREYRDKGLEGMLIADRPRQKRRRCIDQAVHNGLSERLNDPRKGFNSYVEALDWVRHTYGADVNYQGLRNYMIEFFGTKIKRPRKSHVNKSEGAKADFLKLARSPEQDRTWSK